ncbi:MAG: glycoside hydrolase family 31 protein [Kiritimatiellia bacterium]
MYFRKIPYPANFDFADQVQPGKTSKIGRESVTLTARSYQQDIYRITATSKRWPKNHSMAGLKTPPAVKKSTAFSLAQPFGLTVSSPDGEQLLTSPAGQTFGVCGQRSIFVFEQTPDMQFYGMGEKMRGLELSGIKTKFWNTDVFGDFNWKEVEWDRPDPMYVAIPYLIIKRGNNYIGLLLDNPHATFMSTSSGADIGGGQMKLEATAKKVITIGAENGQPDLYIIVGPSLPELTRKLQMLVGPTPLPPAWALGYHQCRWGYKSGDCLNLLDQKFTEHGIPCDGLWLDIDYMDGYRVFTFNNGHFAKPEKTLKALKKKGRRVLPIIDPGVKHDPKYNVYKSGKKADAFCRNPAGRDYIGQVWPGDTLFPDFSMPHARHWWTKWVKGFAALGFGGCWIDMNDPSTGDVLNEDMLFNRGRLPHDTHHNQYAIGMAMATREGFEAAHPGERAFLLSRSGSTGMSKYSALWTGDNMSNYHYLRNCIAVSLNLALSGVPFNGPDVGGFGGNCWPQLMQDWMKACFLFPFMRNHSCSGTRDQEPWAFDAETLRITKHYIQLRYQLRPYLYNLFVRQAETGEAILRPLFYDFADDPALPLGYLDDTFLTGPAILQAPVLNEHERTREVTLPGSCSWFSVMEDKWLAGGQKKVVAVGHLQTPVYLREGSVIPMTPELPETNEFKPRDVVFHILLKKNSTTTADYTYAFDDGLTHNWREGKRSELNITAKVCDGELYIETSYVTKGYGNSAEQFVLHDQFKAVHINGRPAAITPAKQFFAGSDLTVWRAALV